VLSNDDRSESKSASGVVVPEVVEASMLPLGGAGGGVCELLPASSDVAAPPASLPSFVAPAPFQRGAAPVRWAWIALGSRDSGDLGVLDVRGVALGEV